MSFTCACGTEVEIMFPLNVTGIMCSSCGRWHTKNHEGVWVESKRFDAFRDLKKRAAKSAEAFRDQEKRTPKPKFDLN